MEDYKVINNNFYNREKNFDRLSSSKEGHNCLMYNRNQMELTGVINVISFDSSEIILTTNLGDLLIKGTELHISKLNLEKSDIDISGKIDAIIYSNKSLSEKNAKGIMARLFR